MGPPQIALTSGQFSLATHVAYLIQSMVASEWSDIVAQGRYSVSRKLGRSYVHGLCDLVSEVT